MVEDDLENGVVVDGLHWPLLRSRYWHIYCDSFHKIARLFIYTHANAWSTMRHLEARLQHPLDGYLDDATRSFRPTT